ncbi:MAG: ubiquinol oxidase subunit II [Coxiellaceae bacterium]|nr:ubiquinol oxidase subunit II [Coxiellaceae bacterium]
MTKFKTLLILGFSLALSGCKMALLQPKGMIAAAEKNLLIDAVLLMLIVVIPVIFMSLLFTWRYRVKNESAKYAPNWAHSNALEAVCWIVPIIIIGILAVMTWITTHKLDPYRPLANKKKPVIIEVIALDWKWLFIYPKQDIATVNFMEIPTNVPVRLLVTADAPMNSIQIPQLAGQIYAMPGMRTKLNFIANANGSYDGFSANFSGEGFSGMKFIVKAVPTAEYNNWIQHVKTLPTQLTVARYNQLAKPSENNKPEYFSATANNLFNKVMMKYMGPDMKMSKNQ